MWKAIVSILASIFGFLKKRNEDANTPEMKQRQLQQKEIDEKSKIETSVAKQDTAAIRNLLSE